MRGRFKVIVRDAHTLAVKRVIGADNLIVANGIDLVLKRLVDQYDYHLNQLGVGDDNTTPAPDDTDLQASTNKLWKTLATTDYQVSASQLVMTQEFGATEANWPWREAACRDSNDSCLVGCC